MDASLFEDDDADGDSEQGLGTPTSTPIRKDQVKRAMRDIKKLGGVEALFDGDVDACEIFCEDLGLTTEEAEEVSRRLLGSGSGASPGAMGGSSDDAVREPDGD